MKLISSLIKDVPDFPKPGITFKDISPLLAHPEGLAQSIKGLEKAWQDTHIDAIAGLDARGFIFGSILAYNLKLPFIPVRKKGKLPGATYSKTYNLEYGTATIEIQKDIADVIANKNVLVVDDLLATGGTAKAACELIEMAQGHVVGCAFIVCLKELGGEKTLKDYKVKSLLNY